eukprot:CAMPEP_0177633074 /NCGR_PEP_ID=MMETSP0447-20121125/2639_1 /TAXON_ID=0 /ORGANISM="Stygamoeba regulata, Strain BSH-02190019" /LENGTH=957 /DNA_ID=CAMNT_0019134701 /DNA_START=371 /DNA_END=3244 /DNA_ORIENTATION=+
MDTTAAQQHAFFQLVKTGNVIDAARVLRECRLPYVLLNVLDVHAGCAPLHVASARGDASMVQLLLSFRADVNFQASFEKCGYLTPLDAASLFGHIQVCEILLDNGAFVSTIAPDELAVPGREMVVTSLHFAAKGGHVSVAQLLIDNGASVHSEMKMGTPLHMCAESNQYQVAQLLLANGAQAFAARTADGRTPYDLTTSAALKDILTRLSMISKAIAPSLSVRSAEEIGSSPGRKRATSKRSVRAPRHTKSGIPFLPTTNVLLVETTDDGPDISLLLAAESLTDPHDFVELLRHPLFKEAVLSFASGVGQHDNVMFWLAVQHFRKSSLLTSTVQAGEGDGQGGLTEHLARQLYSNYLIAGARCSVDISAYERRRVSDMVTAGQFSPTMFDTMQDEVFAVLHERCFMSNFRKSAQFQAASERLSRGHSPQRLSRSPQRSPQKSPMSSNELRAPISPHAPNSPCIGQREHSHSDSTSLSTTPRSPLFDSILGRAMTTTSLSASPCRRKSKKCTKQVSLKEKHLNVCTLVNTAGTYKRCKQLLEETPFVEVRQLSSKAPLYSLKGPIDFDVGSACEVAGWAAGMVTSTYPHLADKPKRDGFPICDCFNLEGYDNRVLVVLTDGCNWGPRPKLAAWRANSALSGYVRTNNEEIYSTKDAIAILLRGLFVSQESIMENVEDVWEAGCTTILGGMLLEEASANLRQCMRLDDLATEYMTWSFVCVSVGDCKAYVYRAREDKVEEITLGNSPEDPCNPGGRLGPYNQDGSPDLSNLHAFSVGGLRHGDMLLVMSDGIHDNFEPAVMGMSPMDCFDKGLTTKRYTAWDSVPEAALNPLKYEIKCNLVRNLIVRSGEEGAAGSTSLPRMVPRTLTMSSGAAGAPGRAPLPPRAACGELLRHAVATTHPTRAWMMDNPTLRRPKESPGKLDHSSCVCFNVGRPADLATTQTTTIPLPSILADLYTTL